MWFATPSLCRTSTNYSLLISRTAKKWATKCSATSLVGGVHGWRHSDFSDLCQRPSFRSTADSKASCVMLVPIFIVALGIKLEHSPLFVGAQLGQVANE